MAATHCAIEYPGAYVSSAERVESSSVVIVNVMFSHEARALPVVMQLVSHDHKVMLRLDRMWNICTSCLIEGLQ